MLLRINGEEMPSGTERWKDVINPATGEIVDRIPDGNAEDVEHAVESAGSAFIHWSGKTMRERGVLLFKAASLVREHHTTLANLLTREQGKPLREAVDEVRGFCNILEFYAGLSSQPSGEAIHLGNAGDCITRNEPLGVCGAIIPWNMPAIIMGWKVAPVLLAGNTMVFKPASLAPLTTLSLAAVMEEAGLPPGVLNLVTGKGGVVGEAIVRHPDIRKISFTGNLETGFRVRELAMNHLKEVHLELGGSDPMIVWKDADIGKTVDGAVRGRFYNAGQTCTAVKRLYVHEDIADDFILRLKQKAEALRVGDGSDPAIDMGPLSGKLHLERIESLIREIRNKNQGRIITGGERLRGPGYDEGFFYRPTVITNPAPDCPLLCDEVFGPVLPVISFPDLLTAISLANSTRYGLGASVWTHDISVIKKVFSDVCAGVVWVNRHLTLPPEIPFGGVKSSGIGRENGLQAYRSYTRTKALYMNW